MYQNIRIPNSFGIKLLNFCSFQALGGLENYLFSFSILSSLIDYWFRRINTKTDDQSIKFPSDTSKSN